GRVRSEVADGRCHGCGRRRRRGCAGGGADRRGAVEQVDEKSGQPESWFKITERNGVYQGNIVKIFFKPGEDKHWACDKCEGDERGKPVLGLALIKGMQRNGLAYEHGTIMDPRDGSVYRA